MAVRLQIPRETAQALLPEFRRLLQSESVRRTFDRGLAGAATVFRPWLAELASGAAQRGCAELESFAPVVAGDSACSRRFAQRGRWGRPRAGPLCRAGLPRA
ncbi:MAG: hypothetical protein ACK559_42185, partial [bacterium]